MRTQRHITTAGFLVLGLGLLPQLVAAYADAPVYWRYVDYSDIVAVGVLHEVSSSSREGYLRFEGDLVIESVAFGDVSPGDTLRMHWERVDPKGSRDGWGVIKCPNFDPEHEQYAARGDVFPGVRVLWFLTLRDEGGVTAGSSRSLISLSSERALEFAIENLIERPGPAELGADVLSVLDLLMTEYWRHPARTGWNEQRSN